VKEIAGTSLERYLQTHGRRWLGPYQPRGAAIAQTVVGGICALVGTGLAIAAFAGGPIGMLAGSTGPFIAGFVNLGFGLSSLRKHAQQSQNGNPILSPEGKSLLLNLYHRTVAANPMSFPGWDPNAMMGPQWGQWQGPAHHHMRHAARQRAYWASMGPAIWAGMRGQTNDIPGDVLDLLDRAAFQYNRIAAVLSSGAAGTATVAKMGPRLSQAADEAMAAVFHDAAGMVRYPEGGTASRSRLETHIQSLDELARRLEAVTNKAPTFTEKLTYRSGMDEVLEELRLEELARNELRIEEDRPNDQRA